MRTRAGRNWNWDLAMWCWFFRRLRTRMDRSRGAIGRRAILGLMVRSSSCGPSAALRAMGRFLQVITEMIAIDAESMRETGRDAWLEKSLRRLSERGPSGWPTPQEVATEVGLSYENFRKRFVQLTGESPGRYQKRRRLEWACADIYHGEHSLKQTADTLGFCDVFHFSKAFKQEIGLTPSEYRRRVRGR